MHPLAPRTVILVFHADRGHFNACIPLIANLRDLGFKCELWTNGVSSSWIQEDAVDAIRGLCRGDGLTELTSGYKRKVAYGDCDADGWKYLIENSPPPEGGLESLTDLYATAADMKAFHERLSLSKDVCAVVCEANFAKWAADIAAACALPVLALMPSCLFLFREKKQVVTHGFDGSLKVQTFDSFLGPWGATVVIGFIVAECLREDLPSLSGRKMYLNAFKPTGGEFIKDEALKAWLDGHDLEEEQRQVTLITLGSQSVLRSLSPWAENLLIKGTLQASQRVLMATGSSDDLKQEPDEVMQAALAEGRLMCVEYIEQWPVLGHENIKCVISHCGANSTHEILMRGKSIVPLPFFDDQYYIADALRHRIFKYECAPLTKAFFRDEARQAEAIEAVSLAVRQGLSVDRKLLGELKDGISKEDGARQAATFVQTMVDKRP